jgi:hypothetical protein
VGETTKDSAFAYTNLFYFGRLKEVRQQFGYIIQWDQSNRAYIMTHGASGID